MKKNMGAADRAIRLIVAVVIAALIIKGTIAGAAAVALGIVAGVFLLTSFISVCPLYLPFGISTKNKQS